MTIKQLFLDERGQGLVEYALIISFVVIVVIIALQALGSTLNEVFYQRVIDAWP